MKPSRRRIHLEKSDIRLAQAVLLLLLAVYTATFNGLPAGPDGEVSFQTTSSLWRRGSLAIGGTPEAQGLIAHARSRPPGGFSVRAGEGDRSAEHYGWFGVGQALVALPLYGLGRLVTPFAAEVQSAHEEHTRFGVGRSEYFEHLFVGWRNSLLTALTAMLVVLMVRRLGLSRLTAFAAGLGYGLATFAWPQARGALSDVQGTFFVTWSLYLLLLLRETLTVRLALLFGVSAAMAFLTRVSLAPALVVLNVAFCWLVFELRRPHYAQERRLSGKRALVLAAAPQLAALALWLVLNQMHFGNPLDSGYGQALAGGLYGGDPLRALTGLIVSPSKGLVWMAPALLLIGGGILWARREGELNLVWLVLALSISVLLPLLPLRGWHGAWSYGPRYLLPALPGLWVLAAQGFQRSDIDTRLRPMALGLLGFGFLTQLPGALVDTVTYHDLAVQGASERFVVAETGTEEDRAEDEFEALQFDWNFAAPWVHWRILRHRVAHSAGGPGAGEVFPAREIFLVETDLELRPGQERERGYRHLAWVDLRQRLGGSIWPAVALIALLALLGMVAALGALQP